MRRKSIVTVVFCAVALTSFGQDIHFSQYDENPSLVNPALTGSHYVLRVSANYKNQWSSVTVPYTTYGASIDMKLKASAWEKQDPYRTKAYKKAFNRVAAGLSFYSDKAGDGSMGSTYVNLSAATFIKAGEHSSLSMGLQGSLVQRSVDYSKLIFSNQYNGTAYDQTLWSGEQYIQNSFFYMDLGAGVLYRTAKEESSLGENDVLRGDIGAAVFHITNPNQKYLQGSDRLNAKLVVHSKWHIGIPMSGLALAPTVMAQFQGPQKEIVFGTYAKYSIKDNSKYTGFVRKSTFGIGAFYRNKDAIIAAVLIEMGQYAIGVSYDLNISGLTTASKMQGGPEITLRFNSADPFLFQRK